MSHPVFWGDSFFCPDPWVWRRSATSLRSIFLIDFDGYIGSTPLESGVALSGYGRRLKLAGTDGAVRGVWIIERLFGWWSFAIKLVTSLLQTFDKQATRVYNFPFVQKKPFIRLVLK